MYSCSNPNECITYFFAQSAFWKFEFLFQEDSQDTGVWHIAVYGYFALSVYKIEYTLRCLEYICSVFSPLRRHGVLIAKPLPHVLQQLLTTIQCLFCYTVHLIRTPSYQMKNKISWVRVRPWPKVPSMSFVWGRHFVLIIRLPLLLFYVETLLANNGLVLNPRV